MIVRLDRIVTRGGDNGMTSLANGDRLSKDAPIIEAMGTVDELNATIGLVRLHCPDSGELANIQNTLFDIGAVLCSPEQHFDMDVLALAVTGLENNIDNLRSAQKPLTSFVLPGGSAGASWAHLARTVARRAERRIVGLQRDDLSVVVVYLNRLSDFFFVLSRQQNGNGKKDILWRKSF